MRCLRLRKIRTIESEGRRMQIPEGTDVLAGVALADRSLPSQGKQKAVRT
jgi:hypothetical protein